MATEDECERRFMDLFLKLKAQEEEAPKEEPKESIVQRLIRFLFRRKND